VTFGNHSAISISRLIAAATTASGSSIYTLAPIRAPNKLPTRNGPAIFQSMCSQKNSTRVAVEPIRSVECTGTIA
jgi:hypothetical protein